MRKEFIFVIGILAFVSCSKEVSEVFTPSKESSPFSIIALSPDTKTSVNASQNGVEWTTGDNMNVFHASAGSSSYVNDGEFILNAENKFDGSVSGVLSASNDWYVIYPYKNLNTTPAATDGGYIYLGGRSDKSQKQTGDNSMKHLAGTDYPLYGVAKSVASTLTPTIQMKQMVSVVEVVVTNATDKTLTVSDISFTAPEKITGAFYANFVGENPSYTPHSYSSETVSLVVESASTLTKGQSAKYYFAIKPFSLSSGSLKVSVNGYEKTITITKETHFKRGGIKTINFSYDNTSTETIVTKTIQQIVEDNSYTVSEGTTIGSKVTSIALDDNLTMSTYSSGNNGTFWGSGSNINWKLYQTEDANLRLTVGSSYRLVSAKITYTASNNGSLYQGSTAIPSNTLVDLAGLTTYTFNVKSTNSSKSNGQVQVNAVTIKYRDYVPTSVSGVTLNKSTLDLGVGNSESLVATVSPNDADDKSVTWSSSNPEVATVSSSGLVQGVSAGTTTITVTTTDGSFAAQCAVTVSIVSVTSISIPTSVSLGIGQTRTITATITPSNASVKTVTWSTSDSSVATVSEAGLITAVKAGTATIKATSTDGSNIESNACTITVSALNNEDIALGSGSYASSKITWIGTSCTIVQEKGSSSTTVNSSYIAAPRWYQSHVVSFSSNTGYTVTKVEVVCTSTAYATALRSSTYTNATAESSSTTVTITPSSSSFRVTLGAQSRVSSIKVYYTAN